MHKRSLELKFCRIITDIITCQEFFIIIMIGYIFNNKLALMIQIIGIIMMKNHNTIFDIHCDAHYNPTKP